MTQSIHCSKLCNELQNLDAAINESEDEMLLPKFLSGNVHVLLERHEPSHVVTIGARPVVRKRMSAFPEALAYQADYSKDGVQPWSLQMSHVIHDFKFPHLPGVVAENCHMQFSMRSCGLLHACNKHKNQIRKLAPSWQSTSVLVLQSWRSHSICNLSCIGCGAADRQVSC